MKHANDNRQYPPEWCSAETMAYLLDIGASTFRSYVTRGLLPVGTMRGGSVRWRRQVILDAWDGSTSAKTHQGMIEPVEPDINAAIIASIKQHGAKAKARH